jgi:RNA polymerase sigma factor (sigma-70 family)
MNMDGDGQYLPDYAQRALAAEIPQRAVANRCRLKGLDSIRADQIAEEASAEAYVRAVSHKFASESHFRAWLTVVANNVARDLLRRENRLRQLEHDESLPGRDDPQIIQEEIVLCLGQLSPEMQRILQLTYELEFTLDEIADCLLIDAELSPNARRLRVKRMRDAALAALRLEMDRFDKKHSCPPL